jgi:hypothetical protein
MASLRLPTSRRIAAASASVSQFASKKLSNITNLSWMMIMDKSLISLILVGDMGEKLSKIMQRSWPQKTQS